jgi:hypothetical protein
MINAGLASEAEKSEIRNKNFEESKLDTTRSKYGLFSFAGTLAILPHPYEKKPNGRRNSDGSVITEPRNFMTSPTRKGKLSDALFSNYETMNEKYRDPPRSYLNDKQRAERMRKSHDVPFKPSGPTDQITIFEYISPEKPRVKRRRDSEGNVTIEPKNFYTSPAKKGIASITPGLTFGETFEHSVEPFDRPKELKRKERIEHHSKMPDRPFKPTSNKHGTFNKDEEVFDICKDLKKLVKKPKPLSIASHDTPFKPNRFNKSHLVDAMFGEVPEYIPDPLVPLVRKSPSPTAPWKNTTKDISRPTPSVSLMKSNIRSEFKIY